jgi:hypothetical protein
MKTTFLEHIQQAISDSTFVKITLSRKANKASDLNNVYVRLTVIREVLHLSFTFRHETKDIVKNFEIKEGISMLETLIEATFLNGRLFTTEADFSLEYNKKRIGRILKVKPTVTDAPTLQHDKQKNRLIAPNRPFLQELGISSSTGKVFKNRQSKFKQINKYIEIIDGLIKNVSFPDTIQIVDMGSGKGYLTFALYDYLVNTKQLNVTLTGIELRQNLVDFCNEVAQKVGFDGLSFVASDIHDYDNEKIDMLIALHACDIATDIAIGKGIKAKAQIVVCAPCCHKQIRKQMNPQNNLNPILKHGILEERQAEMITDGIRALTLEGFGYQSKVFEFISSEHTAKNLMIVGKRTDTPKPEAFDQIEAIKAQFGIEYHYIEQLDLK